MRRRLRTLTGYQLTRFLAHGGMLVQRRGVWHVYRRPDTRSERVGLAASHIVARLETAGYLQSVPDFSDRRIASEALPWRMEARAVRPPADICAAFGRTAVPALDEILDGLDAREVRIRLKAAAGRFRDDFNQAVRPSRAHLQLRRTQDAPGRMADLEQVLGTEAMQHLEDLIIDRASFAALCVRWQCSAGDVAAKAEAAFGSLSAAYDLSPVAVSPARASERMRSSMDASPLER